MVECILGNSVVVDFEWEADSFQQKINRLSVAELESVAGSIRQYLITQIATTGGHIGANLGTIELTLSIHHTFDLEKDKLLFDVGHQGYTHKLLTGRKSLFPSLNSVDGMSRFINPAESKYDILDASHGGTALSIGIGMASTMPATGDDGFIVVMLGDGAFVEGMSLEALNYGSAQAAPLIVVINDNGMSIPKNVGAVNAILSSENSAKAYFEAMGYQYHFVENGHDIAAVNEALSSAKQVTTQGVVVVHVKTEKGKGLDIARDHPYKLHFSMPFDPDNGASTNPVPPGKSYLQVIDRCLHQFIEQDKSVYAITPSTPYASGLEGLLKQFPENVIDVGMAEQHAAGMAVGLSMQGKKVFLCYQSTFMQRAMDQIFHDICFTNAPITILASRSGFAGFDSATHHAIYDLSYLRGLPNLDIFYASSSYELEAILKKRVEHADKPMIILHPYEILRESDEGSAVELDISKSEVLSSGQDGLILTVGNRIEIAEALQAELKSIGQDVGVVNVRWLSPLDEVTLLSAMSAAGFVITLEENVKPAGFGASIAELVVDHELPVALVRVAIEQDYVKAGMKDDLSALCGLDVDSIMARLKRRGILN